MNTILRYMAYIAIGYTLVVLAVYFFQRNLLYFPDREKPSADFINPMGIQFWPNETEYMGFAGTRVPDSSRGTIIAFHGNAGSAWHRGYFVQALAPLGYRVVLAEYPGYGGRTGKMNEADLVSDAKRIVAAARKKFGGPVYLLGESMGCGVVSAVAADPSIGVAGLVLITPWDSLPSLAQSLYWYLPARWLVKDQYDSIANLKSFTGPVAVAMAKNDEVIPNRNTLRLYNALDGPKQLWTFDNAGHNSWPTAPNESWWQEAMAFVAGKD